MDKNARSKIIFILIVFILIFIGILGRLAYINIVKGEELRAQVKALKLLERDLKAERGSIYDRNGMPFAYSKTQYDITLDLRDYIEKEKLENAKSYSDVAIELEGALKDLSEITGILLEELKQKVDTVLSKNGNAVKILKTTDRDLVEKIKDTATLYGVWRDSQDVRSYPNGSLAAKVIGRTIYKDGNVELVGDYGIEREYEEALTGEDGYYKTEKDGRNNELLYNEEYLRIEPIHGSDVYLTIDGYVQNTVEQVLKENFELHLPKAAHAIVMDVNTGEILAMASYPTFNPQTNKPVGLIEERMNELSEAERSNVITNLYNNELVSSAYELGSTMKLVTTAIALDTSLFTPDSMFDEGNMIQVYTEEIKCWYYPKSHGKESLKEAVANSCNPVFVKAGQVIGQETFFDYYTAFGLNTNTGIDLPAESDGVTFEYEDIGPVEFATMTFGHGVAQTPIQLLSAIVATINDGYLLEPHVVKKIVSRQGETEYEAKRTVRRQPISEITSQQMREIMEYTYEYYKSDGKNIEVDGIRIGVKTGTAEKVVNGEYSHEKAIASLVMVAPIDEPEIAIYVIIDEPNDEIYGSVVAAPIAKTIMESIADYLGFERSYETDSIFVSVPDFNGMTMKDATELLEEMGLSFSIKGNIPYTDESIVMDQFPRAGTEWSLKSSVLLEINN